MEEKRRLERASARFNHASPALPAWNSLARFDERGEPVVRNPAPDSADASFRCSDGCPWVLAPAHAIRPTACATDLPCLRKLDVARFAAGAPGPDGCAESHGGDAVCRHGIL